MCDGLGVRDSRIDELFGLSERRELHLQHIAGAPGDAITERHVRLLTQKLSERLIVPILHGCLNQTLNRLSEQFMIDLDRVTFDDAERFEPSDAFSDGRG